MVYYSILLNILYYSFFESDSSEWEVVSLLSQYLVSVSYSESLSLSFWLNIWIYWFNSVSLSCSPSCLSFYKPSSFNPHF